MICELIQSFFFCCRTESRVNACLDCSLHYVSCLVLRQLNNFVDVISIFLQKRFHQRVINKRLAINKRRVYSNQKDCQKYALNPELDEERNNCLNWINETKNSPINQPSSCFYKLSWFSGFECFVSWIQIHQHNA